MFSEIPSQSELDAIRHLENNRPEEDFCGLTPNEMHDLLYHTFEPGSPLQIKVIIADNTLNQLPFFRLPEECGRQWYICSAAT